MKTNDLISKIVQDNNHGHVICHPCFSFLKWVLFTVATLSIFIYFIGLKGNYQEFYNNNILFYQLIICTILSVSAGISAFILSIPGYEIKLLKHVPLITFVMWISLLFYGVYDEGYIDFKDGYLCLWEIILFSIIPAIIMFRMVSNRCPLDYKKISMLSVISITTLSSIATQLICGNNSAIHFLMWHILPIILLTYVAIFVGDYYFKNKEISSSIDILNK